MMTFSALHIEVYNIKEIIRHADRKPKKAIAAFGSSSLLLLLYGDARRASHQGPSWDQQAEQYHKPDMDSVSDQNKDCAPYA